MSDPVTQFMGAISAAGLTRPKIALPDGKLHRFASNGDARDKAGWYIFHLDGVPAGAFGDFRSGLDQTWRADIDRKLSPQELADCKARVEHMRRQREAEAAKVKAEARKEAIEIWDSARPAPNDHPYLAKKGVKPHGLRVHEGRLVVPMLDDQGTLHSLHYIATDGSKWFLTGGRVAGCFYQIGEPRGVICVGEGFATMATVHEATGHAAVAAIQRTSLLVVAQSFRRRFPAAKMVLCADDDWMRKGNPGLADARAAAAAVGGVVAVPEFGEGRGEKDTDFNDMARSASRDAVRTGLQKAEKANDAINEDRTGVHLEDFVAYMPMHSYIFRPDGGMWPGTSVNARIPQEKGITASAWLDKNSPVEQMTWAPGEPQLIKDRLMAEGAWIDREGLTVFNLYRPPSAGQGNASRAKRWVDLVQAIYPEDVDHLIAWLAHRTQRPQEKINHALVLGGVPGIGKDTLLEPVKRAVGPWNFVETSPQQVTGRFNGFLKSVILRISEAHDTGDVNRYQFYEHLKSYCAAPPDALRIDEKNMREYSIMNVTGVILTTNHKTDGIFLPPDDRRHYVAWSPLDKSHLSPSEWTRIWAWYEGVGFGDVAAYLRELDISAFNPKAPPKKTEAFWAIVDAGRAPEDAELADVLDEMGNPDAFTTSNLVYMAANREIGEWLRDRKNRRIIPKRLETCGYEPVRNDCRDTGLWVVNGTRQVIYALSTMTLRDKLKAASKLAGGSEGTKGSENASYGNVRHLHPKA